MKLQSVQTPLPAGFIDLGRGDPGSDLLPLDLLRDAAADRLNRKDNDFLQYGLEQGDGYFRAALASFLSGKYSFPVDLETLFVTSGISAGLSLLCTLFTTPGDTIFVEEPSYFLALKIFGDHGLRVVSIRTDEAGLVIEDLEQTLEERHPRFVYVIPAFQNPGGRTLSLERRERLVSLAKQHDFLIFADEVYQFLSYTQTPPGSFGAHIDSGHVISFNSFSKILAPGLRLGWMQAHPSTILKIAACGMLDSGGGMNPFTSAIVRSLIESGGLERNIQKLADIYGRRVEAMDELLRLHLPDAEFTKPHGGYFFWVRLPGVNTRELRGKAHAHDVGLRPGGLFSSRNGLSDHMRLSVSFHDAGEIEQGLMRLNRAIHNRIG